MTANDWAGLVFAVLSGMLLCQACYAIDIIPQPKAEIVKRFAIALVPLAVAYAHLSR